MTLVHLSTLMANLNQLPPEEWSNFEFFPDNTIVTQEVLKLFTRNGILRPFSFTCCLKDII